MSRSLYIWLVQDTEGDVVAAFTVKHELGSWLDKNGTNFLVSRIRDGRADPGARPVELNPTTLEPAA
jgi:hypothetical protein